MIKAARFVESLKPYSITAQDVWSEYAPDELLKLDWNESPTELQFYQEELIKIATDRGMIAWYPDYLALELTDALSNFVGVDANKILTFPGSDVGLETLCRTYLNPEDTVVAICPTYENFFVYAQQTGAELVKLTLDAPFIVSERQLVNDLSDVGAFKMVYLASPNNPCGYTLPLQTIKTVADSFPNSLIVIDEAYVEFSGSGSAAILVEEHSNVVVMRTFSKAFGMAGLRLGYLCAPLEVINNVNKIRNGKNVSMIAQRLGLCALKNYHHIDSWIQRVVACRSQFEEWCTSQKLVFYPSEGNFVLFKVSRPADLCSELKARGIYVRNRDAVVPGCVRVTLGSQAHFLKLVGALEALRNLL